MDSTEKKTKEVKWRRYPPLYLMALPELRYLLINNYIPMARLVVAFRNFNYKNGTFGSPWCGWQNFTYLFSTSTSFVITRNTICYNLVFIVLNTVAGVTAAILLSEIRSSRAVAIFQTTMTLPYLLSTIIIGYPAFASLSTDNDFMNTQLFPLLSRGPVSWYATPGPWSWILLFIDTLKNFGFLALIYYVGVVGISEEYYEAAKLNGASRMQQIQFITLPYLKPTVITVVPLAVGKVFYSNFGLFYQVLQGSEALYQMTNTTDTYVYRLLVQLGDMGMASAAGVCRSIAGFILVLTANLIVRRTSPENALFQEVCVMKKRQYSGSRKIEVITYMSFTLAALACVPPILLMAAASFTDSDILNTRGYSYFPEKRGLAAYELLFIQSTAIIRSTGVSTLATAAGTTIGLFFTIMLACVLARDELPFRRVLMSFMVLTLLFNEGMVPTYFMYVNYPHIKNTLFGQLIPNLLVNGLNVMLMRNYFRNDVPKELIEFIHIDSAGELHTFFSIVLSISIPILAMAGLLIGISYWNDWYNGMLYVAEPKLFSMQNFLDKIMMDIQFLSQNGDITSDVNSIMADVPSGTVHIAMVFIATIPVMITFGFVRKYFTKGLTVDSVRG